ncbi:MAG TPA: hypothetical protein VKP69_10980 [Isosphaeraceae bacterium]|nr:hypothetical protein [Isosphaeraceae bacterium]
MVGRASGQVRLAVVAPSDGAALQEVVRRASGPMTTVNTEEWQGYSHLPQMERGQAMVCQAAGEERARMPGMAAARFPTRRREVPGRACGPPRVRPVVWTRCPCPRM